MASFTRGAASLTRIGLSTSNTPLQLIHRRGLAEAMTSFARGAASLTRIGLSTSKTPLQLIHRRGLTDHRGPPKVSCWKDPMSPSKWKEEHFVIVSLTGWGLVIYGGYKLATGGNLHDAAMYERFEQWMEKHGKVYKDSAEKQKRFLIFKNNVEYIESFNAAGNQSYTLGVNHFADLTNEEIKSTYCGYGFKDKDKRDRQKSCVSNEQAKLKMMKQKGSDITDRFWNNLWGKPKDLSSEEEIKERAKRAAARRWREYSRGGVDKPPTFKLPETASTKD